MIKYDDSNDEQYDQCPDCGTDDFIDLEDLRKDDAINDVLVSEKCIASDIICMMQSHYTALEITCMTYVREKFDTQKDFTQLMQLILEAERLQLPKEFIEGLKNDLI
ncbi:MAG: hypothetical protein WCP61_08750 [Chitinophagia bacterium]